MEKQLLEQFVTEFSKKLEQMKHADRNAHVASMLTLVRVAVQGALIAVNESPKSKAGMYGDTPRITIGNFTVAESLEGRTYIEHSDGDGGDFDTEDLEKVIQDFYTKHF